MCARDGLSVFREVDCVLGVGWGRLPFSLGLLGRWGGVVYTGAAVAAAEVRGLASIA